MTWANLVAQLFVRALLSPSLAVALLRSGWRFRKRGWYWQPPFLPLPSKDYVRWRMLTAYGSYDAVPPLDDLVRYVRWAARGR